MLYNLSKEFKIVDLGLLYKDNLIISDLQIGLEDSLVKQGIHIPKFQYEEVMNHLKNIFSQVKIRRTIINGDLKHEFGLISDLEWRQCINIIDFLSKYGQVILVKGNHDIFLGPIANKKKVSLVDELRIDNILILHGHKIPKNIEDINTIVIGHDHPAVVLRKGLRREKYKCFLKGKWKGKELIVLPSFNFLNEGTDVLELNFLSPLLQKDVDSFAVYVIEDKIYKFDSIKNINRYISR